MEKTWGNRLFQLVNGLILGLLAAAAFFPFYYVLVISFADPAEYLQNKLMLFPKHWSVESYRYLLSTKAFVRSVGNSAFLAVVGTICSLLVSSSFAYTLSQRRMGGRRVLMVMVLLTILFSPGIIPHYLLVRELGLIGSLWALIIPGLSSGWNVLLMKSFFDGLPQELGEAAAMDGCGELRTWAQIILPLSLPALAAFGLFFAVGYWNQFFSALLYLNDSAKWPIQVLLRSMLVNATSTELEADHLATPPPSEMLKMAAVIISTAPILMVYPFLQKHFAKGAMVGSVKG